MGKRGERLLQERFWIFPVDVKLDFEGGCTTREVISVTRPSDRCFAFQMRYQSLMTRGHSVLSLSSWDPSSSHLLEVNNPSVWGRCRDFLIS